VRKGATCETYAATHAAPIELLHDPLGDPNDHEERGNRDDDGRHDGERGFRCGGDVRRIGGSEQGHRGQEGGGQEEFLHLTFTFFLWFWISASYSRRSTDGFTPVGSGCSTFIFNHDETKGFKQGRPARCAGRAAW